MCKKVYYAGVLLVISVFFIFSCNQQPKEPLVITGEDLHIAMQDLSDVIVHDIFSPPVASRVYAYPSIAAYEIMVLNDENYKSLAGQLNGLTPIPQPQGEINKELAALSAFYSLSSTLIFSEDLMDSSWMKLKKKVENSNISGEVLDNTLKYGEAVAVHIRNWMDKDNYKQTRTYPKFTITDDERRWIPTPPAYIEAIEPHWSQIRPFVIDSANQFVPERPTDYNMEEGSDFYKETMEVYNVAKNLTAEQSEIASFWDCNPYVMNVKGHVMFATKKITPGGHWVGIVKIACQNEKADLTKSSAAYAMTSIALMDGFISCWDEKFRSNLVRPETVINKYIDEEWAPLLQTPPFPEYTSGHSVISSAAGTVLTSIFGDNFHFIDSTEVQYGLPAREFNSFKDAYNEAAISRLYGGIHYMPAIENGVKQGEALGEYILGKISIH